MVAVVVVYGSPAERLERCVAALLASEGDDLGAVVLVDNRSPANPGVADRFADRFAAGTADGRVAGRAADGHPVVTVLRSPANIGFSAAVNAGVAAAPAGTDLVLLLNDDAVPAPGALAAMARALRAATPDVVGVAPKMVLGGHPGVIDSVGICVNGRGEGMNVGLGQPDIGQFEEPGACFGVCFGAALLRRDALGPSGSVGPLWERSFLYYEDVEWCWRAGLGGHRFLTVPSAVVTHEMSASSRADGYDAKHVHIERNLLLCATRCAEPRRAVAIWAWRAPRLLRRALRGDRGRASALALLGAVRGLPRELRARRAIQRRRTRPDASLLRFADGQRIFFDPVTYEPVEREAALAAARARLGSGPSG